MSGDEEPPNLDRGVTDACARELLERLLHDRSMAHINPALPRRWIGHDLQNAKTLFEGLLAWVDVELCGRGSFDAGPSPDAPARRESIALRLESGLPLPDWARGEIVHALRALNSGQVDAIVSPERSTSRARKPADKIAAQIRILTWIEWEAGRVGLKHEAKSKAALAIGRSPEVFDQWLHVELRDRRETFARALQWARWHGEAEARGETLFDLEWHYDRTIRDIEALAAALKQAV